MLSCLASKTATRLAVAAAVAVLLSCARAEGPYNVVLIGVDTLRPDHLGCYGYARPTSPNIDRLAAQGVLFEKVVSQAPWTTPSFATVFTSLYPVQHGAGSLERRLRTANTTLAAILADAGYATGAVVNAAPLSPQFGVDRGFEQYDICQTREGRPASAVTEAALKWIDGVGPKPFFCFVHYWDPHVPYSPPAPYDTMFDADYVGPIGNSFDITFFPSGESAARARARLTQADWNHIRSIYDGEVAFTDAAVGDLLRGLEERGIRDRTLIVFFSDHGEEFYEHGGFEHGHTLYDELLRVPLIISLGDVAPKGLRVSQLVRLLDITPTVLDLVGVRPADPKTRFEGASLKPLLTGEGTVKRPEHALLPPDIAYSEAILSGPEQKSIVGWPCKIIYDTTSGTEMVFDLETDPGEHIDLADSKPACWDSLDAALLSTWLRISDTWQVEVAASNGGREFEIEVKAEDRTSKGDIFRYFFHDGRHLVEKSRVPHQKLSTSALKIFDLKGPDTLTVAFKVKPKGLPVSFDLRIDGQSGRRFTFVGDSLSTPTRMPFIRGRKHDAEAVARPSADMEPPYFLVWHSGPVRRDEPVGEMGRELRKTLRALGYVH